MGRATEPDLRARAEVITPEAASLPTPHGVSGPPANGTRDGATVSPFGGCVGSRIGAAEAKPHTVPVSTRGKERKMLSATLGMLAMPPVVVGVAGYAMVSR